MHELESLIRQAWERVKPLLQNDLHELQRRLARRRSPALLRPPRAWCLVVRASDQRINSFHAATVPDDAADPRRPHLFRPHEVSLDARLLRRICRPIRIAPGHTLNEIARMLGITPAGLTVARLRGRFDTHYIPGIGGRGKPVPLLHTDQPLDPSANLFAPPDPLWHCIAETLIDRIPPDLEQDIERIPHYRPVSSIYRRLDATHPEAADLPPKNPSRRLPPPPPDYVWYKWDGDTYVGDRLIEKYRRKKSKPDRQSKIENPKSTSSALFDGWQWICPGCGRPVRRLYYPLPPLRLPLRIPREIQSAIRIQQSEIQNPYPPCFACKICHHVRFYTYTSAWNDLITYLSGGLLYGREVQRPDGFIAERRRPYRPRPMYPPSRRRPQVMEMLLKGMSYARIAAELGVRPCTISKHATLIYAEHRVHGLKELARKLGVDLPPPRAPTREAVGRLLDTGLSYREIAQKLGLTYKAVKHHGAARRRAARAASPPPNRPTASATSAPAAAPGRGSRGS